MKYSFILIINLLFILTSCKNDSNNTNELIVELPIKEPKNMRQILYLSQKECYNWQIYLMNENGSNQRRITNDSIHYGFTMFFPDGQHILATSKTWDHSNEIYTLNIDGSDLRNITNSPGDDFHPHISSDGSKIIFVSNRDGNNEIYIMDRDGQNQTRLTSNSIMDCSPQFINNSSEILYATIDESNNNYHIYKMNIDGSNKQCLTTTYNIKMQNRFAKFSGQTLLAQRPVLSPDGSKLAFMYAGSWENYGIMLMNLDGSNLQTVVQAYDSNLEPHFTPQGDKIIFVSHRTGQFDLFEISINKSTPVQITQSNLGHAYFAEFSPDGSKILLEGDPYSQIYHIYTINRDGTNITALTEGSRSCYMPSYQPLPGD